MRLDDINSLVVEKLFEVLVEMAVIVVAKLAVVKITGSCGKFFNGLADAQNL